MINDLVTRQFKNNIVNNLVWRGKVCWEGANIAALFGYTQERRAVYDCIQREKFQEGIEYETLNGEELKEFKEIFSEV